MYLCKPLYTILYNPLHIQYTFEITPKFGEAEADDSLICHVIMRFLPSIQTSTVALDFFSASLHWFANPAVPELTFDLHVHECS